MTREEQIKQAAEQFADREHGLMRFMSVFNQLQYAFKCGAEWADNSNLKHLWHDASEMPNDKTRGGILCKLKFGMTMLDDVTCYTRGCKLTADRWEEYVEARGLKQWAYISDLLPSNNAPSAK